VPGWNYATGIFVSSDNPISKLTIPQLDGIFGPERDGGYQGTTWNTEIARRANKNILTWGGWVLRGEWDTKPIRV
jgi:phosphate transport system substrate-binding protein